MKFLESHRKDLEQIMKKAEIHLNEISYVKKKGRINVIYDPSKASFAYIKKKEVHINDETHAWEESSFFKVSVNSEKEIIVLQWQTVSEHFERWVKRLSSNH